MEILELINSYIKYVYILLGIVVFVLLIKSLMILSNIGKNATEIKKDVEYINIHSEELKKKGEIIEHTMKTSVPFFISVFAGISIVSGVIKDYFDTKPTKRSIKKSVNKVYRYKKSKDTPLKGAIRTIKTLKR